MKTIAKVLESMLTKDATQSWAGQPTMPAPERTWWWAPASQDVDFDI